MPVKRTNVKDSSAKLIKRLSSGIEQKKHVGKTKKEIKTLKKTLLVQNSEKEKIIKDRPKKQKNNKNPYINEQMKEILQRMLKEDEAKNKNLPNIQKLSGRGKIVADSIDEMKEAQYCANSSEDPLGMILNHVESKYGAK